MNPRKKTKIIGVIGMLIGLFLSGSVNALCLRDCNQASGGMISLAPSVNYQQNQAEDRQKSHNFGNESTNVLGDVNVRVGHEHIEIKGMENSNNSLIDASVHSTVIMGNLKQ